MDECNLIREAIFYSEKYRNLVLAVFFGNENVEKCQERGILRDIRFLKQVGISVIIGHYTENIDTEKWHDVFDLIKIRDIKDLGAIKKDLTLGFIPIVYCEDNAEFSSYDTIALLAANIGAQKLVYITRQDGVYDTETNSLISEMSTREARKLLESAENVTLRMRGKIEASITACEKGIPRIHIISGRKNGSLIREIFSCQGQGTMIYENQYRAIRKARSDEINSVTDILRLSTPVFTLSPAKILEKIDQWYVFVIDDQIRGCMELGRHTERSSLEISFLTTSKTNEDQKALRRMLEYAINEAIATGSKMVFMEKSKTILWLGIYPWLYKEFGFQISKRAQCAMNCKPDESHNIVWLKNL